MQSDRCDEEDANAVSICVFSLNQTPRQKTNVDHLLLLFFITAG